VLWQRQVLSTVCAGDVTETSFVSEVGVFFLFHYETGRSYWFYPQTTPQKLVGLYSSFIHLLSRTCFVHTHYDSPHIHPSIMHILCLLCPTRCSAFFQLSSDLPSSSPHLRVHHFPAPLTSAQVLPCRYIFLPPLFIAHLCSPRFCVS